MLILLGLILYYQLLAREDLSLEKLGKLWLQNISIQNIPILILVLLLMPLNWFFETKKWLFLMQKIQPIATLQALQSVMTGVTFSLFTPNRIGEYGGRMLLVDSDKRYLSICASGVGIISQWIVLVVGGWWAMIYAFSIALLPIQTLLFYSLVFIGIILSLGLFFLYYQLEKSIIFLEKYNWAKKWTTKFKTANFEFYTNAELNKALFYSFLRYATYSFQYLLLLYFFGFNASVLNSILGIMIVYLLQTGIPLPPSTGLLARGNIALFVFGYISVSSSVGTIILAATFSLWIINVVFPALLGAFFTLRLEPIKD